MQSTTKIMAALFALSMGLPSAAIAQEAGDLSGPGVGIIGQPAPVTKKPEAELPDQKPIDRIRFLLSGYEYFPTRDDLDKVGSAEEISTLLRQLASEPTNRPTLRLRAVDALGYYEDETTRAYLETLIEAPKTEAKDKVTRRTNKLLRHHAITSIARAHGENALSTLEPLLVHEDVQLKMTAISAIGKHTGKRGKERLQALAKTVKNPVVKRELRKHLKL